LQRLTQARQPLHLVGFSADGRYLAAEHNDLLLSEVIVFDLQTGQSQSYLGGEAAMPWSPRGHLLALAGPGGLYVADPATGETQWLTNDVCRPSWFEMP
jgi:hypothetical protein